jgi:putative thiamine transport system substrate-binding protein
VVANFLLTAEAQARKNDLKVWGDPTVLDIKKLSVADATLFSNVAMPGSVSLPSPAILEPHGSFVPLIESTWLVRFGNG